MNKTEETGIGPREHSFFITFLFLGINVSSISDFFLVRYYNVNLPIYFDLFFGAAIFVIGYLIFFRGNRANRIITYDVKTAKIILFVIVALAYAIVSVYLMFKVGDYVRFTINR